MQHIISYFAGSLTDCQNNLIGGAYGLDAPYFFVSVFINTSSFLY